MTTSYSRREELTELGPEGTAIGRDPRSMDYRALQAHFGPPRPLLKAIRDKCLDCCCGSQGEVAKCTATDCPLWPYRMGKNTLRPKRKATPGSFDKSQQDR